MLIVLDPDDEWSDGNHVVERIGSWTTQRGDSPRLYPGSLVWCARKPGRELRRKVELWLAWQRVAHELAEGVLGAEYDRAERSRVQAQVMEAHDAAKEEVWAGYRFVALADNEERHGLKVIDLGAGHASAGETLCGRIISVLKAEALLNESVGAGYLDRNWPPAFKDTGAWPLTSLRQSFLTGALTRLIDPDAVLRNQIMAFVSHGDFGFASGRTEDGGFQRLWYTEPLGPAEVSFDEDVFLLTRPRPQHSQQAPKIRSSPQPGPSPDPRPEPKPDPKPGPNPKPTSNDSDTILRLAGSVPPEVWNRIGIKLLPKLRSANQLTLSIDLSVTVGSQFAPNMETELRQILNDLGLSERVRIEIRE